MSGTGILDASVSGDISIETNSGVLKSLGDFFTKDNEDEFNVARRNLVEAAKASIKGDSELYAQVRESSNNLVSLEPK